MLDLIRKLWTAACLDKPERPSCKIENGNFVFTISGNKEKWLELSELSGVPAVASQEIHEDKIIFTWPTVDSIFASNGPIAQRKPNYEMRLQQLQMARLVQRTIEMNDVALVEAGTGTGKGFAYMAPAMMLNKRMIISTSNKALQAQLIHKDIPFLLEVFPGKKVCLAQGKSNYACMMKCQSLGNVVLEGDLAHWYAETTTGNIEEIEFPLQLEQRQKISIDDTCPGRKQCEFGADCFYYVAKDQRETADIIVTNHALLCLSLVYDGANILPATDVIVVDEAHKLTDYARNALGINLPYTAIVKALDILADYSIDTDADAKAATFSSDISLYIAQKIEPQIGVQPSYTFESGCLLATELRQSADEIWDNEIMPSDNYEWRKKRDADRVRKVADKLQSFSMTPPKKFTRWIEYKDGVRLFTVPFDVSQFLSGLVGYTTQLVSHDRTLCTRCGRKLTAQAVSILDDKPYGPDCIEKVDILDDAELINLEEWLTKTHPEPEVTPARQHATIFTSATLAAPDMSMFMREVGVKGGMVMEVDSPFDYPQNALLYIPNGASPAPADPAYPTWIIDEIERLISASNGSAFLLFTSYANMRNVRDVLEPVFRRKYPVYVQGDDLGKLEMAKRFASDGNAVLFGTKSFFEGVSIEGDALRLVVVDKMPFAAPHPITTAIEADLIQYAKRELKMDDKKAEWYPFEAFRLPVMIIDLKQAFGRLIRTRKDYGTVAILDTRLRTARYGRSTVLPALPDATLTHDLNRVLDFYAHHHIAPPPVKNITAPINLNKILDELSF